MLTPVKVPPGTLPLTGQPYLAKAKNHHHPKPASSFLFPESRRGPWSPQKIVQTLGTAWNFPSVWSSMIPPSKLIPPRVLLSLLLLPRTSSRLSSSTLNHLWSFISSSLSLLFYYWFARHLFGAYCVSSHCSKDTIVANNKNLEGFLFPFRLH